MNDRSLDQYVLQYTEYLQQLRADRRFDFGEKMEPLKSEEKRLLHEMQQLQQKYAAKILAEINAANQKLSKLQLDLIYQKEQRPNAEFYVNLAETNLLDTLKKLSALVDEDADALLAKKAFQENTIKDCLKSQEQLNLKIAKLEIKIKKQEEKLARLKSELDALLLEKPDYRELQTLNHKLQKEIQDEMDREAALVDTYALANFIPKDLDPETLIALVNLLVTNGLLKGAVQTEIMLITQEPMDLDMLEVMRMRAHQCAVGNKTLIILSYRHFAHMMTHLMNLNPEFKLTGIDKLSVLHHHSERRNVTRKLLGEDYTKEIGKFASNMQPQLKEILLRMCSVICEPKLKPYMIHFIKSKDQIPLENELLISQKKVEEQFITTIKYLDPKSKEMIELKLNDIANIGKRQKISNAICAELNNHPSLQHLTLALDREADLRKRKLHKVKSSGLFGKFFDRRTPLTDAEKLEAKDAIGRLQTKELKSLDDQDSFILRNVVESLSKECKYPIKLVAYLGAYKAGVNGVVPSLYYSEAHPKSYSIEIKPEDKSFRFRG